LLYQPGLISYGIAWQLQQQLVAERRQNAELADVFILLEHPPVYTLGQGASLSYLKFDLAHPQHELFRVERGGEVTYHCPGQLVGYPILNLRHHRQDLHWYLRELEAMLIETLAVYGLKGERKSGFTGVWIKECKVAAIGIKVSRWITMHGFALNVCPDLEGFQHIVPCGIVDKPVGSLVNFIPGLQVNEVSAVVAAIFGQQFNVKLVPAQLNCYQSDLAVEALSK
jgi:lipoyl(octanoyl) transferase